MKTIKEMKRENKIMERILIERENKQIIIEQLKQLFYDHPTK